MIRYENHCVGCPTEMGCLGSSCPYQNVPVHHCDKTGCDEAAMYILNGKDFCEEHALEYLNVLFESLSIKEMADALEVNFEDLENDL